MNCCDPPITTEALAGDTEIVVSTGATVVQEGNLNDAIWVLQLNVPLAFRYSAV